MVATALRFCLDMPAQAVPRQHCPCGWHGVEVAPAMHTAELRALTSVAQRDWARHAVSSCPKGVGPRGHVHDDIADVFVVLLKNAGFVDVEYEDVWWDSGAAYDDSEHRRPDITCKHPVTGVKLVFDVVVWWGASARAGPGGWWSARTSSSRSASRPAVPSARRRGIFYGRWRGSRARRRPRTSTTGVRWCGGSTGSSA